MASLSKSFALTAREQGYSYYELHLSNGQKRCCGTLKDVECVLSIYPDAVYSKVLLPADPDPVDVSSIIVEERELRAQRILSESTLEEINLTDD